MPTVLDLNDWYEWLSYSEFGRVDYQCLRCWAVSPNYDEPNHRHEWGVHPCRICGHLNARYVAPDPRLSRVTTKE